LIYALVYCIAIYASSFGFPWFKLFLTPHVGLPGVLWVLPDSYIDVKNKDYGGRFNTIAAHLYASCGIITNVFALCFPPGDKYINGEIIPCTYPTYQPKERRTSKYESRRYERRRDGPPASRKPKQQATQPESASSSS
jgi:hypothetical protein